VSPYFEVIKPSLTQGFNYKQLTWDADMAQQQKSATSTRPTIAAP
jgi:hypothetical protein